MFFYFSMFFCNLLIPATMIFAGYFMYKHPVKNINHFIGYRTKMSMKNEETWKFAQLYCGKLWCKTGIVLLILSMLSQISFIHADDDTIGFFTLALEGLQIVILLVSIYPVEKALKKTFDKNGNKR